MGLQRGPGCRGVHGGKGQRRGGRCTWVLRRPLVCQFSVSAAQVSKVLVRRPLFKPWQCTVQKGTCTTPTSCRAPTCPATSPSSTRPSPRLGCSGWTTPWATCRSCCRKCATWRGPWVRGWLWPRRAACVLCGGVWVGGGVGGMLACLIGLIAGRLLVLSSCRTVRSRLRPLRNRLPPRPPVSVGWHEFAEFTAEDVGTVDSGLNSMASRFSVLSPCAPLRGCGQAAVTRAVRPLALCRCHSGGLLQPLPPWSAAAL